MLYHELGLPRSENILKTLCLRAFFEIRFFLAKNRTYYSTSYFLDKSISKFYAFYNKNDFVNVPENCQFVLKNSFKIGKVNASSVIGSTSNHFFYSYA